jgi:hypothetical protein
MSAVETACCAYCEAEIEVAAGSDDTANGQPPAVRDNAAWAAVAKEHASSCTWVASRAFRLTVKRYACTLAVVDAAGDFVRFDVSIFGGDVDARTVSSGTRIKDGELCVFDVAGDEATHDHVMVTLEADDRVLSFQARVLS